MIADQKKVVPIDSEFPGEQNRQKNFAKKIIVGPGLSIYRQICQILNEGG